MFYINQIGTGHNNCPVGYKTKEEAIVIAKRICNSAMKTNVYDCTQSNVGKLIVSYGRDGSEIK